MSFATTDAGHVIHAEAMYNEVYHLAWGVLPSNYADPWGVNDPVPISPSALVVETVTRGTSGFLDQLANVGIIEIESIAIPGGVTYSPTTDYLLNGRSIDWSPQGQEPAASAAYTVVYRYNTTAITALLSEVGRRSPTIKQYVLPDPNGDIIANDSSWSLTGGTSRHLYLQFKFDSTDAAGSVISQLGLFVGTVAQSTVPQGQKYLLPSDVLDPGQLYMVANQAPNVRLAGKREILELVLSF